MLRFGLRNAVVKGVLHYMALIPFSPWWRTDEGVDGVEASGNRVGAIRRADAYANQVPRSGPLQSVGASLPQWIAEFDLKDSNPGSTIYSKFV